MLFPLALNVRLCSRMTSRQATQIGAGHVGGLYLAEATEQRGCNVAQRAARLQSQLLVFRYQNERNRVRGVIGMRPASGRIDHRLRVAMIGGDDPPAAVPLPRLANCARSPVPCPPRF